MDFARPRDEPVVLALVAPTKESLAEMARIFGEQPVVLTRDTTWFTWTEEPTVLVESRVRQAGYHLGGIPRTYIDRDYEWFAGLVNEDGSLEAEYQYLDLNAQVALSDDDFLLELERRAAAAAGGADR